MLFEVYTIQFFFTSEYQMSSGNHFSNKYKSKSFQELNSIIHSKSYLVEARIAAINEIESRQGLNDDQRFLKSSLEAELERVVVQRRNGTRYNTLWPRFVASIVDSIALWPLGLLLDFLMDTEVVFLLLFFNMINHLAPFLYSILLHGKYGQTLGKYAMSVKVIGVSEQQNITFKQALMRDIVPLLLVTFSFFYMVSISDQLQSQTAITSSAVETFIPMIILGSISFIWAALEILTMLFHEKSRALHDLIANTVVVRI